MQAAHTPALHHRRPCRVPGAQPPQRRQPPCHLRRLPAAGCLKCASLFLALPGLRQEQHPQASLRTQQQQYQQQQGGAGCAWSLDSQQQLQLAWAAAARGTSTSSNNELHQQQALVFCSTSARDEEDSSSNEQPIIPGLPPLSSLLAESTATSSSSRQQAAALAAAGDPPAANSSQQTPAAASQQPQQRPPAEEEEEQQQHSPGVQAALAMLRWYKSALSPMMQSTCRFLPTCSSYSMDAYKSYGVAKGTVLTAWRLLRCNPWGPSGYDPVAWPPPGLPGWLFAGRYSAEVAVVLGGGAFVRLAHALLFE